MSWGPQTNPNGTALTGRKSTLPPVGDLVEDLRNGMTLCDMADVYGVSADRIRQVVNNAGYSSIDGQPTVAEPVAELADLAAAIPPPGPWVDDALCAQVDSELFFPPKGGSTYEAKAVCARCPVVAQCLDYALSLPQQVDCHGIWGGTSERERRHLRAGEVLPERTKTCPGCGEEFVVYHAKRAYCSKACQNKAHWRRQALRRAHHQSRRTA